MYVCNCKCVVEAEEGSVILSSKRCSTSMFAATWFSLESLFKKVSLVSVKDAPARTVLNGFIECHSLNHQDAGAESNGQRLLDSCEDNAMLESMRDVMAKEGFAHGQFLPSDFLFAKKVRQSDA